MNPKTIQLTTRAIHSQPGYFHAEAIKSLIQIRSGLSSVVAHWEDPGQLARAIMIDIDTLGRPSVEDEKRLGRGWVTFTGHVNNDSLFDDEKYRSVPVTGFYEVGGYTAELTFDADCPPTETDWSM